jgi:hypothetical protein
MSMKNSTDTIGNRTRDLPAGSAVPQPTAPPRAPIGLSANRKFHPAYFILHARDTGTVFPDARY